MEECNIENNNAFNAEDNTSRFSHEENSILQRGIASNGSSDEGENTLTFSEQKKKSPFSSKKFLVNMIVIVALAVFVGVQGGLLYLNTFVKSFAPPSIAEEALRDDAASIYATSIGKTPDSMSALDAVIVADYLLTNCTNVQKKTVGSVVAMGVTQQMVAIKKRVGNRIYSEKLSTGLLSVGNAFYHTLDSDYFEFYSATDVSLDGATWPSDPSYTWNYATYIDHFRSKPEYFINYIISSKTVLSSTMSKTDDGNYKVSLDLDAVYSVLNYLYEIRETSGSSKFPNFKYVHLDIVMDRNFRVLSISVDELYDVAVVQLGGGYVETRALMTETFSYEGVAIDG